MENERNQYEWKLKATKVKSSSDAYGEALMPNGKFLCLNLRFAAAYTGKMQSDPAVYTVGQTVQQIALIQEGSSYGESL